jgi:hypothetical protein
MCIKCQKNLNIDCFQTRLDTGKRRNVCNDCQKSQYSAWKAENKDYLYEEKRKWYLNNKDKSNEAARKWAKNNRSIMNKNVRKYQAQKKNAVPKWLTAIELAQIQEMYDVALARTVQTGIVHHVDHILPLNGKECCGLHVPSNLQILTAHENISKSNRVPILSGVA